MNISTQDISTAHRVGKKPIRQGNDKRGIIVKLCRRDLKYDFMHACRNQPTGHPRLYVNESLTPARSTILFTLRQMKKAHPNLIAGCSSYEGRIYAYTKDLNYISVNRKNRRHLVNTHAMLQQFCSEHVKRPFETFLENWNH